ncbi:MAG: ribonuclease III [Desulfohalobiaceae bacterium]
MQKKIQRLQKDIGHVFQEQDLLLQALTHSSYANETDARAENNERLEFLGDAVLELCISEELYQRYPQAREGDLTRIRSKLVSEPTLAELARSLKLQEQIFLGRGEESQGGRQRDAVLCDALESVFGAVFLDSGYAKAQQVILDLFRDLWPSSPDLPDKKDYKSSLQELTQKLFKARPVYTLQDSFGPEHAKTYVVELDLPDGRTFTSRDSSLKKAEQAAARQALQKLQERG